jgi:hypothetical protein
MIAWCRANIEPDQWAHHGHVEKMKGQVPRDYARFYFAAEADSDLFWWRWCLPR